MHALPIVSVVIPAFNAAATISATLASVLAQTLSRIEVIVVDDGSQDDTLDICGAHSRSDPRLRVISQANQGVAAARNAGVAQARGEFVAPLDADDLWAPGKLQAQLDAFARADSNTALVYTLSVRVDEGDRLIESPPGVCPEGYVLPQLCTHNFILNGSAAMIRRSALVAVGGFEPGVGGCEDYALYLRLAERWPFGVVRAPLTAYRQSPGSYSNQQVKMLRSHVEVIRRIAAGRPELKDLLGVGLRGLARDQVRRNVAEGEYLRLVRTLSSLLPVRPLLVARIAASLCKSALLRALDVVRFRKAAARPSPAAAPPVQALWAARGG